MPLRDDVFFPEHVGALAVGRPATIAAIRAAMQSGTIVVATQRDPDQQDPEVSDLYAIACAARVVEMHPIKKPVGAFVATLVGLHRVRILFPIGGDVHVETLDEPLDTDPPLDAYRVDGLREIARRLLLDRGLSRKEAVRIVSAVAGPGRLVDLILGQLPANVSEKQRLLEELDVERRLRRILGR